MRIVCIICTDAVTEDFCAAPCGHTFHHTCLAQWLAHKKSCPQCREKCLLRNVLKLFVDSSDSSMLSSTQSMEPNEMKEKLSLQESILKHKEQALSEARESLEEIRQEMEAWRAQHETTHRRLKTERAANSTMKNQLSVLQYECDQAKEAKREASRLKQKLSLMEGMQRVLADSKEEVEALVKNYTSPSKLATFVIAMKREYEVLKDKKTVVQREKDRLSQEVNLMRKQLHNSEYELQCCRSRLEVAESDLQAAEQERESLQRKVELLEKAMESPGSRLALRRILESPMPDGNDKQVDLGASPLLSARTHARTGDADKRTADSAGDKPQVLGSKRERNDDGVLLPVNKIRKHSSSKSFASGFNGMGGQLRFAVPLLLLAERQKLGMEAWKRGYSPTLETKGMQKSKPLQQAATKGLKFAPRMTTQHKLKSAHPPTSLRLNFH